MRIDVHWLRIFHSFRCLSLAFSMVIMYRYCKMIQDITFAKLCCQFLTNYNRLFCKMIYILSGDPELYNFTHLYIKILPVNLWDWYHCISTSTSREAASSMSKYPIMFLSKSAMLMPFLQIEALIGPSDRGHE